MNILFIILLSTTILILWFKTWVFIEYVQLLKLNKLFKFLKVDEVKDKLRSTDSGEIVFFESYPKFLQETYPENFIIKILSCEFCFNFWISVIFCIFSSLFYFPFIYIGGLFVYFLLNMINKYAEE